MRQECTLESPQSTSAPNAYELFWSLSDQESVACADDDVVETAEDLTGDAYQWWWRYEGE